MEDVKSGDRVKVNSTGKIGTLNIYVMGTWRIDLDDGTADLKTRSQFTPLDANIANADTAYGIELRAEGENEEPDDDFEQCSTCSRSFPIELIINDNCPLCSLQARNKVHGLGYERFSGEMANELFDDAVRYIKRSKQTLTPWEEEVIKT